MSGVSCTYSATSDAAKTVKLPPTTEVSNSGTVQYVMKLNGEALGLTLLRDTAPCTVNSFTSLAAQGFFDATACHRLVTSGIYVLQCGDPSGTGSGGPGYRFDDELAGTETYPAGTLAMANAGANTNGSQFFIVFADSQLSASYTVFGKVDAAGLKVVEAIAAGGTDNSNGSGDGKPKLAAVINSVQPS
jgi:peptidyl-prolyl cis-trans isomerase B (cyclophilin B)